MQNNLTPEYVIVPREASDEMVDAINDLAKIEWDEYSALGEEGARVKGFFSIINTEECFNAALSAAPPHNLIAVDKGEWERLRAIENSIWARLENYSTLQPETLVVLQELAALEQKQ